MLSPEDVREMARARGLAEHADRLVERVRPGWRLVARAAGAPAAGASKIGGHPDLASGEAWPLNRRGIPLTFLAQIDCSALPPTDDWIDPRPWRHDGALLRVFADLVDNPNEPGPAIALACDPSEPLVRTTAPPIPDPFPPGGPWDELDAEDRFHVLPEAAVELRPFLTAPEIDPELRPELHDFSDVPERYGDWAAAVRAGGDSDEYAFEWHHLLGEPTSIQDDVRGSGVLVYDPDYGYAVEPDAALLHEDAWRVLLALHFDEEIDLYIHDGGAFTVLAPVEDLARGRYDRLVCSVDSG